MGSLRRSSKEGLMQALFKIMRVIVGIAVVAVIAFASSVADGSLTQTAKQCHHHCPPPPPPPTDCGVKTGPPTTYAHVVWVWMENHSYSQIIGSSSAPYI